MTTMGAQGFYAFSIASGLIGTPEPELLARALRRAVMARVQAVLGKEALPTFFSGHKPDGRPAGPGHGGHLAFLCDLAHSRLLLVAPHVLDRREQTQRERDHWGVLEKALSSMRELLAGRAGRLVLLPSAVHPDLDPLTAPSRVWESLTPYLVNRHTRRGDAGEALAEDLRGECRRRGLPSPSGLFVLETQGVPGRGLAGRVRLRFPSAVRGPLVLGKSRHLGGGVFVAAQSRDLAGLQEP